MELLLKIKLGVAALTVGSSFVAASDLEDTKNPDNSSKTPQTVKHLESPLATITEEGLDYIHTTDQASLAVMGANLELNAYLKSCSEFSIVVYSELINKLNKAQTDLIEARFKYIAFHHGKRVYSVPEALNLIKSIENNTVKDVLIQAEQAIEQINGTGRVEEVAIKPVNCPQQ
ncbi:hypothetical protein [Candidatus Odyssella thessalonicensis]|uniref:hypothetical protein n=1 Tax=Candidatus Odyssella thessalonicensis TaxID=84647 RepID=UPI000225B44F|nr:hypothetical protein [Candidatus Odyssella thessalonicensis]